MPRVARAVREPSCVGIVPEKMLLERSKLVRAVREPICVGTEPVNSLPERSKLVRAVREPICVGREPLNSLLARSKLVRRVRKPICVGSASERELPERSRLVRAVRLPIEAGRLLVRALLLRSSEVRALSEPIWVGIVPETPEEVVVLARLRAVTRCGPGLTIGVSVQTVLPLTVMQLRLIVVVLVSATVTPSQFWIFCCEEEPVPQERRKLPGMLSLAETAAQWCCIATRAWQSSIRSLLVPATLG